MPVIPYMNDKEGRLQMEFSNDTVKKLRGLIVFTVVAAVAGVNYRRVLVLAETFVRIIFPFLLGGAIAFVLNVPMRRIESLIRPGRPCRWRRALSLTLAIVAVGGVVVLVAVVVMPELVSTLMGLKYSVPLFFQGVERRLEELLVQYPDIVASIEGFDMDWERFMEELAAFVSSGAGTVLAHTFSAAQSVVSGVVSFGIGFVFAIYILMQKETLGRQAWKLLHAYLPKKAADEAVRIAGLTQRVFSSFLAGQCMEAVILGVRFFVVMTFLRMPYALLIGVLLAFRALRAVCGAFFVCAVGAFLILMVNPFQAALFVAVFLILQQIEGNLIYPHVVGNSVGLPSIWVLAAVTVGGSMMGVVGMLVFIPAASVAYTLLRENVNRRLAGKG